MSGIVNHVGLAVGDLQRSRRFYEEVFGFEFRNEMSVPDAATTKMFDLEGPLGVEVVYLQRDGWVLELMSYVQSGMRPPRVCPLDEPGITHISISVDDVDAACAKVVACGGQVLHEQGFRGIVEMVRDPDGQLIEILPMSYRDNL